MIKGCNNDLGCYLLTKAVTSICLRKKVEEVVPMRDYEILIVVFTVIAIIVSLLVEYIKK